MGYQGWYRFGIGAIRTRRNINSLLYAGLLYIVLMNLLSNVSYGMSCHYAICCVTRLGVMLCPTTMPYAMSLDCMLTYDTLLCDVFVTELFPFT